MTPICIYNVILFDLTKLSIVYRKYNNYKYCIVNSNITHYNDNLKKFKKL